MRQEILRHFLCFGCQKPYSKKVREHEQRNLDSLIHSLASSFPNLILLLSTQRVFSSRLCCRLPSSMSKYLIFNDKENTGQSSPSTGTKKRARRPLQELSSSDIARRETFYEFTVSHNLCPLAPLRTVHLTSSIVCRCTKQFAYGCYPL